VAGEYEIEVGGTLRLKCGKTLIELHANGTLNITCEDFNITGRQAGQINTLGANLDLTLAGGTASASAKGLVGGALKASVD
ncbi:hypothetical protein Q6252_28875, partial [Klebsiella pneumoniae]|nr:hypothetical protein [Klebsiella pneumoniae]